MGTRDKLLERFLNCPKDFTYNELKALLNAFKYYEYSKGKTSGSRVCFYHETTKNFINLHKPHPSNILKAYQIKLIIKTLKENGDIL